LDKIVGDGRRIHFLRKIGLHRKYLTPRKAKLYNLSKTYLNLARHLDKENTCNAEYIEEIVHLVETGKFLKQRVNLTTWDFIKSQIQQQNKRKRGRRFSLEDKLMGLLLMKQSPKGYKLLKKNFALPSRKTLTNLLNKVPFRPGINIHILNTLKKQVEKLPEIDRTCALLFDEISLQPFLQYNKKYDALDGFENYGAGAKRFFFIIFFCFSS
jgi:hypothetical protein